MQFFRMKDMLRSWSNWVLTAVAVTPVVNETTPIFHFIPEDYKPLAITVMAIIGLVLRGIKQASALKLQK